MPKFRRKRYDLFFWKFRWTWILKLFLKLLYNQSSKPTTQIQPPSYIILIIQRKVWEGRERIKFLLLIQLFESLILFSLFFSSLRIL